MYANLHICNIYYKTILPKACQGQTVKINFTVSNNEKRLLDFLKFGRIEFNFGSKNKFMLSFIYSNDFFSHSNINSDGLLSGTAADIRQCLHRSAAAL